MTHPFFKALALVSALTAAPALANPAMPLPADATAEETAAYGVLVKHCARCHQDGALKEGLTKAKSGFGHVLDIRRLAQDTKFVVQGEVIGSKLHNVIGEWSYPSMPDDCTETSCYPTQAEADAVASWIEALGQAAPPPRTYVSMTEMFALAHDDLLAQPTNRRDRIRYLSLRVLHNDTEVSDENLEGYRASTIKLINALSWNPTAFRAEPVDTHGVLIRIFLPDIDWDHAKWSMLEAVYPYGVSGTTDPRLGQLQQAAGTQVPVIRADWFASRAPVSPLYYDLLGLPGTVQGLEALLGLDMARNIRDEQVIRAGFQDSGVSSHNRLIERHPLGTGYFWTSYDFAGSAGRQSFFEYPLGPNTVFSDQLAFHHDGGESIFTLPNGFHAYYLNTSDGARLDVGPTQIVRDDDYTDGTGEVVNGISCISCHINGIRLNEDQVRNVALNDLSLPPAARQKIDALYPGQEVVADYMQRDTDAFFAALTSVGIEPGLTAGGLEPVRGLFVYHVDAFVDFAQAANELGLTEEELRGRVAFVGPELASLFLRLDQSPIARDEWTAAYPVVVERVTDYKSIGIGHRPAADLSYSVAAVLDDYTQPAATHADPGYTPTDHSVQGRSALTIYTDKPAYKVGEGLRIFVEPRHDCRLTLLNIDDKGKSCVLYPHPALPDVPIKGGTQYVFPPTGSLTANEAGIETILAICNAAPEAVHAETRDTSRVSCDAGYRVQDYEQISHGEIIREVLSLDLGGNDKIADNGVAYKGLSSQNPHVAKAKISAPVTAY